MQNLLNGIKFIKNLQNKDWNGSITKKDIPFSFRIYLITSLAKLNNLRKNKPT